MGHLLTLYNSGLFYSTLCNQILCLTKDNLQKYSNILQNKIFNIKLCVAIQIVTQRATELSRSRAEFLNVCSVLSLRSITGSYTLFLSFLHSLPLSLRFLLNLISLDLKLCVTQ
jgi:hypothetical protein